MSCVCCVCVCVCVCVKECLYVRTCLFHMCVCVLCVRVRVCTASSDNACMHMHALVLRICVCVQKTKCFLHPNKILVSVLTSTSPPPSGLSVDAESFGNEARFINDFRGSGAAGALIHTPNRSLVLLCPDVMCNMPFA